MHRPQCPEGRLEHTERMAVKMNDSQPNVVMKVKETDILPRHVMLKSTHGEKRGTEKSRNDPRLHTPERVGVHCLGTMCPTLPEGHMEHTGSGARLWGWNIGAPPSSCVNVGALCNLSGPGDKLAPTPGGVWGNE